MLKDRDLKIGKWIPDYCLVRTEFGWVLPSELTKREKLLVYEDNTIKSIYPKSYNKIPFKGTLLGNGKLVFKPSDNLVTREDEWFKVSNLIEGRAFSVNEVPFEGFLYSFDIDPIVSYEYKISKVNNNNLLKLEYIL